MGLGEQKLKKVGTRERSAIALSSSTNRRYRENWKRQRARRLGPAACTACGQEPCGVLWTRPGDPDPAGERCCEQCDHEPVEGWQHTHTAWSGDQTFAVCALVMREGETIYLRRDGMVQFIEMRAPKVGSAVGDEEERDVPMVAFLGREERHTALTFAGEGGDRSTNLWDNRRELDPLWLPVRLQAAVSRDEERKARRRAEREERESAHDRKVEALMAKEEEDRQRSIEKRALQHETRIVMDEVEMDENDLAEDALAMPSPSADGEGEGAELASSVEAGPVDLKAPQPVKKGPGRPKRSYRQRRARERQKRAWARQEASNRLEVKRLERLARTQAEKLVKGDE